MSHEVYQDPVSLKYQMFTYRKPAWHFAETQHKVFDEWPGREEAMEAAGHNFTVRAKNVFEQVIIKEAVEGQSLGGFPMDSFRTIPGYNALVREDTGVVLSVMPDSYVPIQNEVMWDMIDAIVAKPEVHYETGGTLRGGRRLWVMAWLDEPWRLAGDSSITLPRLCVVTSHDGTRALEVMALVTRVECENTYQAGRMEAIRRGYYYAFRHTANVQQRLAQADEALDSVRRHFEMYKELVQELAKIELTTDQVEMFVIRMIPAPRFERDAPRAMKWVEAQREKLRDLIKGPTVPEAHKRTGYGVWCAGIEYFDHIRAFRSSETYFNRSVEPSTVKLALADLIRDL